MAGVIRTTEMVAMSKSVQEMSTNGDEPPPQYIVKESTFGPVVCSPQLFPIPVIDISLLASLSSVPSKEQEEELEKLKAALSSWGSFQAIGHGMPISFLNRIREVAKQFFALPIEEKRKNYRAVHDFEGYGYDSVVSEKQILDWSDRLFLKVLPEDQRRFNLWPENPNDFREILHEYCMKIKLIMDLLFKVMAKSLNLEEKSFSNQFGDTTMMQARFNFYPICPRPDLVLGLKAHTDKSGITILLQDEEVEGLQLLKDGIWVGVPIIPHALLVNLGDQMQIMSNGIFKSPLHRVVTNSERERISVAMLCEPEPNREIEPAGGLIDETRPRLYRTVRNYGEINYECFQKGKVALDTVKIQ